jgi:hypothetical protein
VMMATISAICFLARASASGNSVVMSATISAVCCLARAGASGNFVVMTAGVHGDLFLKFPHSWLRAGWDHLLLEYRRDCL